MAAADDLGPGPPAHRDRQDPQRPRTLYITLRVRIAIAGFLGLQRRWWHLAAFTVAVVVSEVLIGMLKGIYDRDRPPGSFVATTGASSPSGDAIATSVTAIAAVIALVPRVGGAPGGGRLR